MPNGWLFVPVMGAHEGVISTCVDQIASDPFNRIKLLRNWVEPGQGTRQPCASASYQPSCVNNKSLINLEVFRWFWVWKEMRRWARSNQEAGSPEAWVESCHLPWSAWVSQWDVPSATYIQYLELGPHLADWSECFGESPKFPAPSSFLKS